MTCKDIIDQLTYNSWWYQINWYGMKKESVRLLYQDWKIFEEYEEQKKEIYERR